MTIDWVTWSIWLVGFLIMVLWILLPLREFRRLLSQRKKSEEPSTATPSDAPPRRPTS